MKTLNRSKLKTLNQIWFLSLFRIILMRLGKLYVVHYKTCLDNRALSHVAVARCLPYNLKVTKPENLMLNPVIVYEIPHLAPLSWLKCNSDNYSWYFYNHIMHIRLKEYWRLYIYIYPLCISMWCLKPVNKVPNKSYYCVNSV